MSQVIGLVSKPGKQPAIQSNCKISKEGDNIVLCDDTSERPFCQKHPFATIVDDFSSVIQKIPSDGSMRIISICSDFSTPTITQIRDFAMEMAERRVRPTGNNSVPISVGLLYDKDVQDLIVVKNNRTELFEMLEAHNIFDALDLIQFSFEKFRRFKECIFVLHIGDEPFFEWIIVPSVDSFVPSPSITGLPPNEKLVFILKLFPTMNENAVERYRRISNVFRLVSDTFCDIPTLWVAHFAKHVTFKSNAALFRIVDYINDASQMKFEVERSNLFYIKPIEIEKEIDAISEMTMINDAQREEALREEQILQDELMLRFGSSSDDYLPSDSSGLHYLNDDKYTQMDAKRNHLNDEKGKKKSQHDIDKEDREQKRKKAEEEAEALLREEERRKEEEAEALLRDEERRKEEAKRLKEEQKLEEKQKREEARRELEAKRLEALQRAQELAAQEDESLQALRNMKKKKKAQKKKKNEEKEKENAQKKEKESAESRLERERQEAEDEKIKARLMSLREKRKQKNAEKKKKQQEKALKESVAPTQSTMTSKRERITQKMMKMRAMRIEDLVNEYEEEEEEEDQKEVLKKKEERRKKRERDFLDNQFLVMKAKKLANNPNSSINEMKKVHAKIMEIMNNAEEKRRKTEGEILRLKKQLKEKKKMHDNNVIDLKDIRQLYIETHNKNIQVRVNKMLELRTKDKKAKLNPEYEKTIRLLKLEISKVKNDIMLIQQRAV